MKTTSNQSPFRDLKTLKFVCCAIFICAASFMIGTDSVAAQGLNWEGQSGAFVTPFAYTPASPKNSVSHPEVSFHFLNTGKVIGNNYQVSVTAGAFSRVEFGYTRSINQLGGTPGVSKLFNDGFNTFHGKVNLIPENAGKKNFIPAISVGFTARTNMHRVGGVLNNKTTVNGDVYVVATKTITQIKGLPILLSGGLKGTNASVLGLAGNAPDWEARFFGAAAFVVKGPVKSTLIFGSEFCQQPRRVQGLPGVTIPTTLTYFVRILPKKELPLAVDFGVAQVAGKVAPGVDLQARSQFAMGISYRF